MDYRRRLSFLTLMLFFTFLAAVIPPVPGALAKENAPLLSTTKDRVNLELTVYNDNFAFVRETREITVKKGSGSLKFTGVPATIQEESILLRPLTENSAFTVLEQSFQGALKSKKAFLDNYIGKKIRLEIRNSFNDRVSSVDATLLSNSDGPIYKIGDEIYLGHRGIPVLPGTAKGLAAEPEISWRYTADSTATYRLETSYLAKGLQWQALYRLILHGEGETIRAGLSGWIDLTNESGTDFKGARVRFLAGRPQRAKREAGLNLQSNTMRRLSQFSEVKQAAVSPVFEYHIYDISRRIDINNGEQKQLRLLEAGDLTVKKEYELRGRRGYFRAPLSIINNREPVSIYLKVNNLEANSLETLLPAGIIDIYQDSQKGGLELIGSDNVTHRAAGDSLRLKAGIAGDIKARRTQREYKKISSALYETTWEIKLANNKARDVVVNILEPLSGSWKILSSSHPYTKVDAFTVRFKVKVPAGEEVSVRYRARVGR